MPSIKDVTVFAPYVSRTPEFLAQEWKIGCHGYDRLYVMLISSSDG